MPINNKLKDGAHQFGYISIINHWVVGLVVILMLILGLSIEFADLGGQKREWLKLHKSLGALVLIFGSWRVLWRMINGFPSHVFAMPRWQVSLSKLTHILLLSCLIVMPLSGYVMTEAGGRPVNVFMLFSLPPLPDSREIKNIAELLHSVCAYTFCGLLILHVGGVLKHQFIDKKPMLQRILYK